MDSTTIESPSNYQLKEVCKKCNQTIHEGHAYELGEDRWHINCFNCSKCQTSLGCNSNFLVLGNGNLICSNCSYNCKQCNRKIDDLAILTGDQAYCSSCFKCRSCKNKIEDLRYARTSKGLFCMDCHEKLVAKKKKYDAKKKHLDLLQQKQQHLDNGKEFKEHQSTDPPRNTQGKSANSSRNSLIQSYMNNNSSTSIYEQSNNSSTSLQSKNKQLPKPPSSNSSLEKTPKMQQPSNDNDFSIEEVQNSSSDSDIDENETIINGTTSLRKNKFSPSNQFSTPQLEQPNIHQDQGIQLDIINTPSSTESSSVQNQLKPAANLTPKAIDEDDHNDKGKNLLILSPNQYHDNEFHATRSPAVNSTYQNQNQNLDLQRSGAPSPFAKANRQARVVETNDETPSDVTDENLNKQFSTPKKQTTTPKGVNLSSPPPRLPLPSTPTRKQFDESIQKGLGLEGVDYEPKMESPRIYNTTPAVTNLESTPKVQQQLQQQQNQTIPVSRTASIIRGLKHKRSTSGGANKFGLFKNKEEKGHSRHVSDGSVTSFGASGSSFITPPLTNNGSSTTVYHTRSTSDSTMLYFEEDPYDLNKIKYEVQQMHSQKMILDTDLKRLKSEKSKLSDNLKHIQSLITSESIKYDNLINEINELNIQKQKLFDENKEMIELNKQIKDEKISKSLSNDTETSSIYKSTKDEDSQSQLTPQSQSQPQSQPQSQSQSQLQQYQQNIQTVTSLEDDSTHKATRLKFWRRPKIGTPQVVPIESSNVQYQQQQQQQQQQTLPIQQKPINYPSHGLRVNQPQSNGNKFTKSVSTNILDSFLNPESNNLFNTTIQKRSDYENNAIPFIITRCIMEVENRGLDFEGIYRISGGNSTIVQIEQAFTNFPTDPTEKQIASLNEVLSCDIHAITSALKRYLRKLPDPVIPYSNYDEFIKIAHLPIQQRIIELDKLIGKLPIANQKVLRILTNHLNKINSMNHLNRMNFKNLSVVFAPTLARDQYGEKEMIDMGQRNDTTETLLTESFKIFT